MKTAAYSPQVWTIETGKSAAPSVTQVFDALYVAPLVTGSGVNYTVALGDRFVPVDTAHAHTVTLPDPARYRGPIVISDVVGAGADTNNVTIARNASGDTINGTAANLTMDQDRGTVTLIANADGTGWWQLNQIIAAID